MHVDDQEIIRKRLKLLLDQSNFKVTTLAQHCNKIDPNRNIKQATISAALRGHTKFPLYLIALIAKALDVPIVDIDPDFFKKLNIDTDDPRNKVKRTSTSRGKIALPDMVPAGTILAEAWKNVLGLTPDIAMERHGLCFPKGQETNNGRITRGVDVQFPFDVAPIIHNNSIVRAKYPTYMYPGIFYILLLREDAELRLKDHFKVGKWLCTNINKNTGNVKGVSPYRLLQEDLLECYEDPEATENFFVNAAKPEERIDPRSIAGILQVVEVHYDVA